MNMRKHDESAIELICGIARENCTKMRKREGELHLEVPLELGLSICRRPLESVLSARRGPNLNNKSVYSLDKSVNE